jgi:hypothetical protein
MLDWYSDRVKRLAQCQMNLFEIGLKLSKIICAKPV